MAQGNDDFNNDDFQDMLHSMFGFLEMDLDRALAARPHLMLMTDPFPLMRLSMGRSAALGPVALLLARVPARAAPVPPVTVEGTAGAVRPAPSPSV